MTSFKLNYLLLNYCVCVFACVYVCHKSQHGSKSSFNLLTRIITRVSRLQRDIQRPDLSITHLSRLFLPLQPAHTPPNTHTTPSCYLPRSTFVFIHHSLIPSPLPTQRPAESHGRKVGRQLHFLSSASQILQHLFPPAGFFHICRNEKILKSPVPHSFIHSSIQFFPPSLLPVFHSSCMHPPLLISISTIWGFCF